MRTNVATIIMVVLIGLASCSMPMAHNPATFEEAISPYVEVYGEPDVVRDTYFLEDGTVSRRLVSWDISSYEELSHINNITREEVYYTTLNVEVANSPHPDSYNRFRIVGWVVIRETRNRASIYE